MESPSFFNAGDAGGHTAEKHTFRRVETSFKNSQIRPLLTTFDLTLPVALFVSLS
jgi:hypothetical protein